MLTTLISDCDGVLVDSEVVAFEVLVREAQAIFPQMNVNLHLTSAFGQKTEELVRQLAVKANAVIPEGFLLHLRQVTDATIEAQAKAVADVGVLVSLPELKAVASNSGMARVRAAAKVVGLLNRGDVQIFSADQVENPKPAPDLYHLVAQSLAVSPQSCLVIEDSLSGVVAAQRAGMQVIGFTGGAHIPAGHDDALREAGVLDVFQHMKDLPFMLKKLTHW